MAEPTDPKEEKKRKKIQILPLRCTDYKRKVINQRDLALGL